jgi:hypothetical protein
MRARNQNPADGDTDYAPGGAVPVKARIVRAAMTAAMLAIVVQSFGAAVKW